MGCTCTKVCAWMHIFLKKEGITNFLNFILDLQIVLESLQKMCRTSTPIAMLFLKKKLPTGLCDRNNNNYHAQKKGFLLLFKFCY